MQWTWLVARASGFTAYGLVTLSVVLGLALSQRWQSRTWWPRLVNDQLHQYLMLLAGVFTAVHGVTVWIDPFTKFKLIEVLVPGAAHYRPLWMALGIVAAYLGGAIALSSWLRPKIGYKWWRRLHYLTFVVWLLATLHGLGDGSDSRAPWAIAIYGGSALLVVELTLARLLQPADREGRPLKGWATLAALVSVAGILFALWGPLRPGWNKAANNGNGSGQRGAIVATAKAAAPPVSLAGNYAAPVNGQATENQSPADGSVTVQLKMSFLSGPPGVLTLVLKGTPLQGGGVAVTRSSVLLGTSDQPDLYQGQLLSLNGGRFAAQVEGSNLKPLVVSGNISIDQSNGINGTVQVQPLANSGRGGGE